MKHPIFPQRSIPPWGIPNPQSGREFASDAATFVAANPIGTYFAPSELVKVQQAILPHWGTNLSSGEVASRLSRGGLNKNCEPQFELVWLAYAQAYALVSPLEAADFRSPAQKMGAAAQREKERLDRSLQCAAKQIAALPEEEQARLKKIYAEEERGVKLAIKWADPDTPTLRDAVHLALGDGNSNGEEYESRPLQKAKK